MNRIVLALVLLAPLACASNRANDTAGARIHDTTLTPQDTTNPNDTLPRVRDSMVDSTQ